MCPSPASREHLTQKVVFPQIWLVDASELQPWQYVVTPTMLAALRLR
jgi:hypothetical protein